MRVPRVDDSSRRVRTARAVRRAAVVACLLSLLAGCAVIGATARLQQLGEASDGALMLVAKPAGLPGRATPPPAAAPARRDAVTADESVAAFVAAHGIPDAVAIGPLALSLQFAYLADRSVFTVESSPPGRVSGSRTLTEDELAQIEPDHRAAALQTAMDNYGRLQTVSRALSDSLPPMGGPVQDYGVVLLPAHVVVARAFGGEANEAEKVVAWVRLDSGRSGDLRVGDRIVAIDGVAVPVADRTGGGWEGPTRLSVRRGGETFDVELTPQTWPQRIYIELVNDPAPNALVVPGGEQIIVTTGLLALLPEDDALAAVLGHEYAHIALGHAQQPSAVQRLAVGVAALGLLPVLMTSEIARPGTSHQVVQAMHKGFSRDQERDADRLGLQYARGAGYDPHAALVALDRLQQAAPVEGVDQFFDLHPPYPERRALLEAELHRSAAAP
jgi:Zn-dependent protease with chaperone function